MQSFTDETPVRVLSINFRIWSSAGKLAAWIQSKSIFNKRSHKLKR